MWIVWGVLLYWQSWHFPEKIRYDAYFLTQFSFFPKKKKSLMWFRLFATTSSPFGIDTIQSYICVISNSIFLFVTHLFLLKDFLRNENNSYLRFCFFCKFSTQFSTITSKPSILSNEWILTKRIQSLLTLIDKMQKKLTSSLQM
jgi:hypothetical protein